MPVQEAAVSSSGSIQQQIFSIERPAPALMKYYLITALLIPPLFPIVIIPAYFRYHTLRYRFDEEGISMRWGILFRKEVNLTYSRIQDIHISSGIIERWLKLARIQIQTASGSASAEMTIEGLHQFEMIRDFLYAKMRGEKEEHRAAAARSAAPLVSDSQLQELTAVLGDVAQEVRALRTAVAAPQVLAKPSTEEMHEESQMEDTELPQPGPPFPERPAQEDVL